MNCQGLVTFGKQDFYPLFRDAWEDSFTIANIRSAFEATGVFPLVPDRLLDKIAPPGPFTPVKATTTALISKTPNTIRPLRKIHRKLGPLAKRDRNIQMLIHADEALATKASIAEHVAKGLRFALVTQKKKQQKIRVNGLVFVEMIRLDRYLSQPIQSVNY